MISKGSLKQEAAEEKAAERIASATAAEKAKEGALQGLLGISSPFLSKLTDFGMKALTTFAKNKELKGLLDVMSFAGGPAIAPFFKALVTGGLTWGAKSIAEGLGAGGDSTKIAESYKGGKYGYGKSTAETYAKGLEKSDFNPFSGEAIATSMFGNYLGDMMPNLKNPDESGELWKIFNPKEGDINFQDLWKTDKPFGVDLTAEEGGRVPTISEYFDMQNKTIGGNSTKSIAELLERV